MTHEEARRAQPSLQPVEDSEAAQDGIARLAAVLTDGLALEVRLREDRVLAISLSRPGAVYEPAYELPPPAYPAAEEPAGAPFTDPNFKLVVMDELLSRRAIDLGEPEMLARHLLGAGYSEDRDGYEFLEPVYRYLVRYPLTPDHLAAVEQLGFDGGNEIYTYPFPFWDGESEEFDVSSLGGIELLQNLRSFLVSRHA